MKKPTLLSEWEKLAEKRLKKAIELSRGIPALAKAGPKKPWQAGVKIVGKKAMTDLNYRYRKKKQPTDVLSFPTEFPFRDMGFLGELIICLPVLKSQAGTLGHSPRFELDVLLTHGLLHLLGFDHEKSLKDAAIMAKWEGKLLRQVRRTPQKGDRPALGLINRIKLGMEKE